MAATDLLIILGCCYRPCFWIVCKTQVHPPSVCYNIKKIIRSEACRCRLSSVIYGYILILIWTWYHFTPRLYWKNIIIPKIKSYFELSTGQSSGRLLFILFSPQTTCKRLLFGDTGLLYLVCFFLPDDKCALRFTN